MSRHREAAGAIRMLKLAVTSSLSNLDPAIVLNQTENVTHLHEPQRSCGFEN
jgi:hypothetical protein